MRLFLIILFSLSGQLFAQNTSEETISGLEKPVEIKIDQWGIAHIYAETEADLFFAQGYNAARDRLFQFEVWRRQATGTVAEILGERELKRDIGTRLFMFRGNMDREMNYYHPRGKLIIESFVKGVNAYIDLTEKNPGLLPAEFEWLGIKPQKWTNEVVISRHQGLLGNITRELDLGRLVHLLGVEKVKSLNNFHPNEPKMELDPKINGERLMEDILGIYNAFRRPVRFQPEDIIASNQGDWDEYHDIAIQLDKYDREFDKLNDIGSNNWVIRGEKTESGYPIMANDPHRTQAVPSLRYMAHLVGPGWNVIGGGEPEIPGISIGHNEYGTWGLTVFRTDAEDLYVYETNPENPNQYRYQGEWEDFKIIKETIEVKNSDPVEVELKYSRHGPVVFEDKSHNLAYTVRAGWMEIGGSPYLASLRMDQARNWEEFREACRYSHIPGENMIWADKEGNIGWQAVGIAPIRNNWSGMVPVPGDGTYEWDGYLPIKAKPNLFNPPNGFIATANANVTERDYEYPQALGFDWADPYRQNRLKEILGSNQQFNMMDMMQLQTDYLSIPARTIVPFLKEITPVSEKTEKVRQMLLNWDYKLEKSSIEAGIYVEWEKLIYTGIYARLVPSEAQPYMSRLPMTRIIEELVIPGDAFSGSALRRAGSVFITMPGKSDSKPDSKIR